MDRSTTLSARSGGRIDRLARAGENLLRLAADARFGLALLVVAGGWNAAAAAIPGGGWLLDGPPYLALLGAILLSGLAAMAVRTPAAWREWRGPAPLPLGEDVLHAAVPLPAPLADSQRDAIRATLESAGYRLAERTIRGRWTLAGVRRGWSRFAALGTHVAVVVLVLGAAIGAAFASETTFSLLPGEQALLDAARPGYTDAVRLDGFEAEFGADGRPRRLDTAVTFLRDGRPIRQELLQVNRPGAFAGYLLHGWTYGPAAGLRLTTLGGRPLLDAPLALDAVIDGRPAAVVELPSAGVTVGLSLVDATANVLSVAVATDDGLTDAARLRPGETRRIGPIRVRHDGFTSYVTFLSRRDPGMGVLFGAASLLVGCLAVAFWLPRRRLTVTQGAAGLELRLRGERFDRPEAELVDLQGRLAAALERRA